MKVTVVPASAQTLKAAVADLLDHPSAPSVVGVYRNLDKAPDEFKKNPHFQAVLGNLHDASTLDFSGSEVVVVLSPPHLDGSDYVAAAKKVAQAVRDAIAKAPSVRRLVYISSMGAQYEKGTGEVMTNHVSEHIYRDAAPEVVFIRNTYFMENWISAVATIKSSTPHFYSTVTPADYKLPMISARDIGRQAAKQVFESKFDGPSPKIVDLQGPEQYSSNDVKKAFEEVTGKSIELRLVPKDQLHSFFSKGLPATIVDDFVEMTESFLPGGITEEDMKPTKDTQFGKDTLVDSFKNMFYHIPDDDHIIVPSPEDPVIWFAQSENFDEKCRQKFGATLSDLRSANATANDILSSVRLQSAAEWVDLIILLDQIPRNCYRGEKSGIAYRFFDPIVLEITKRALDLGIPDDPSLRWRQTYRFWFYLPLEHSEDPKILHRAKTEHDRLFGDSRGLMGEQPCSENKEALHCRRVLLERTKEFESWEQTLRAMLQDHIKTIESHGRYPHRDLGSVAYINGSVFTVDSTQPWAEGFIVSPNGTFTAVGMMQEITSIAESENLIVVNLHQRFVMPGIHDAHVHTFHSGLSLLSEVILGLDTTNNTVQEHWIVGVLDHIENYDRSILDEDWPDNPVLIHGGGGHIKYLNTLGLERVGFDLLEEPETNRTIMIRREDGSLTGEIGGQVVTELHRNGVTSCQEAAANSLLLEGLYDLDIKGELKMDYATHILYKNEWLSGEILKDPDELIRASGKYRSKHVDTSYVKFMMDGTPVSSLSTYAGLGEDGKPDMSKILQPNIEELIERCGDRGAG
ncbi:hypothetical protein HJFPF1_05842 [Paramyrothecium foliicola]|nr:hypothetical protein HJFPF1_05842 [Paramyrothecium foliicola]